MDNGGERMERKGTEQENHLGEGKAVMTEEGLIF